jgi:hypothetical protein
MSYSILIVSCVFIFLNTWLKPPSIVQKLGLFGKIVFHLNFLLFTVLLILFLGDWYYRSEQFHLVFLTTTFLISLFLLPGVLNQSQKILILKIRARLFLAIGILSFFVLVFNFRNTAFTSFNGGKVYHDDDEYVLVKQAWTDPSEIPHGWYIYPDIYKRNSLGFIKKLTNNHKVAIPEEFSVDVEWREVHIDIKFTKRSDNSTLFYYGLGK